MERIKHNINIFLKEKGFNAGENNNREAVLYEENVDIPIVDLV